MSNIELGDKQLFLSSLKDLTETIREINDNNGWNLVQPEDWKDNYKIPTILCLIGSELIGEALEGFRADDLANFYEELADGFIRELDLIGGLPHDPEYDSPVDQFVSVMFAKILKNSKRGYKHGGKRV